RPLLLGSPVPSSATVALNLNTSFSFLAKAGGVNVAMLKTLEVQPDSSICGTHTGSDFNACYQDPLLPPLTKDKESHKFRITLQWAKCVCMCVCVCVCVCLCVCVVISVCMHVSVC